MTKPSRYFIPGCCTYDRTVIRTDYSIVSSLHTNFSGNIEILAVGYSFPNSPNPRLPVIKRHLLRPFTLHNEPQRMLFTNLPNLRVSHRKNSAYTNDLHTNHHRRPLSASPVIQALLMAIHLKFSLQLQLSLTINDNS